MRPEDLVELAVRFTDSFNSEEANALDTMMAFFTEKAIYDEYNGKRREGRAQIRAAFEPQFKGALGKVSFQTDDVFADGDAGKALVRWTCTIKKGTKTSVFRGVDIVHISDGKITHKLTYTKTDQPLFES